jgi:hypothetical protein
VFGDRRFRDLVMGSINYMLFNPGFKGSSGLANVIFPTGARNLVDSWAKHRVRFIFWSEDPKQHLFVCEIIWVMKNVQDEDVKIAQLETTFRGHALVWYMKLQSTTPTGKVKTLAKIRQALLKEFKKPKSES